jgi:hypothetical protein
VNIDELARSAATEARSVAAESVDPTAMLARLYRTRRNRSVASIVAIVVVAVAVAIGTVVARTGNGNDSAPAVSPPAPCVHATCHHVVLKVPVTFTLPKTFQKGFHQYSLGVVEVYRRDIDTTGVTVAENATPVRNDYTWTRDPAAGTTAKSVATWLAQRPFLSHTALVATQVGGLPAWRVAGQLKPGAALHAVKDYESVAPTFLVDSAHMAYAPDLIGEYTVVDVPGAGITVIWSWSVGHGQRALAGNRAFIDTLAFH